MEAEDTKIAKCRFLLSQMSPSQPDRNGDAFLLEQSLKKVYRFSSAFEHRKDLGVRNFRGQKVTAILFHASIAEKSGHL